MAQLLGNFNDEDELTFDTLAPRLNEFIECEDVDDEVQLYFSNILRTNMLLPIQTAYLAAVYQVALNEAYMFKRQLQREMLAKGRKFHGTVKMWVLELRDIDIAEQLPALNAAGLSPSLAVRVSMEGMSKLTTRSVPSRNFDGTLEPLRIQQDLDMHAKRPTSILHIELLHINDDMPSDSLDREVLVGSLVIPLRKLESQKMVRQWYSVMYNDRCIAELKMRLQYSYKEDVMQIWDPDSGMPRGPDLGGPNFILGIIGVGQVGVLILDGVLRCGCFRGSQVKVSTRTPEKLAATYDKLGVSCVYDDAGVAQRSDVLIVSCLPTHIPHVAREIRGHVRASTLVISIVAGFTPERLAQMLRLNPGQVVRPRVGGESGLPMPDPDELPKFIPPQSNSTSPKGSKGGNRALVAVGRAEVALEKRRWAELCRKVELRTNVKTAYRVLLPDSGAREDYVEGIAQALGALDIPKQAIMNIASASLTGAVPDLQIWGEHVQQPYIPTGTPVLVFPSGTDLEAREGIVRQKPKDARNEYLVLIGETVHCLKRTRLFVCKGAETEQDAKDAALAAVAAGGNTPETAQEGFMLDPSLAAAVSSPGGRGG